MSFGEGEGLGSDAAEGQRIERREERARVYRIVARNRHVRRLPRGAATWLLRGDFLTVATAEYPLLLESLRTDVMEVIEVERGRAGRMGPEPKAIFERGPVRAALEAWWSRTRIRPPWLEQIVMDTLRAWVLGGMPGSEVPGFEQWVIEPHLTEDPPGMGADLDELVSPRFDIGETKEEFLARASRYYARGMRVLRMYRFLDPKRHSDHGVSRLDRLRMIAHARVGPLRPKDARKRAWELVCLHEPVSDDGEFGPQKQHGRYPEKRIDRLCREVECLLDLPPLKVRKSPISTS